MIINDIRKKKEYGPRKPSDPFYRSNTWRSLRAQYLQAHPTCACGMPATLVDHKIQIIKNGSRTDWSNLEQMCDRCHHRKCQKEATQQRIENEKKAKGQG